MAESRDRVLSREQATFRATTMVIAPVSVYRRPLPTPEAPLKTGPETAAGALPGPPSRVADDLDQVMVKLRAAAAKAQQVPAARRTNAYLLMAAAIALSMIAGAVTAQYLIPGHPRPSISLSSGK